MKLTVVGLGPGAGRDLTGRAYDAIEAADLVVGYTAYIALIRDQFPEKEMTSTGMKKEVDRCRMAVEAERGRGVLRGLRGLRHGGPHLRGGPGVSPHRH